MRRKVIGIVAALLLAGLGTYALVAYVQQAKDEAVAEESDVTVFVVSRAVRTGAGAAEIAGSVDEVQVPSRLRAADAVTDLAEIGDLVTSVELLPGEQLLRSRLVAAESLVRVDVPTGLQEITVALDPERALGANLEAGDAVGVLLSFPPFDIGPDGSAAAGDAVEDPTIVAAKTPNMTHLTLNDILVTGVQLSSNDRDRVAEVQGGEDLTDEAKAATATVAEAPGEQVLVTLAVSAPEAEQVVFAAEFGTLWLTGQNGETDDTGSRIVTLDQAYLSVARS